MIKTLIYSPSDKIDIGDIFDEFPQGFEPIYKMEFEKCTISPYGLVYKNFKVYDEHFFNRNKSKNYYGNIIKATFFKRKIKIQGCVINIISGWCDSYYHFTMENLIKLYLLRDVIEREDSTLVFPEKYKRLYHEKWFELMGVKNVRYINDDEIIMADRCITTSFAERDLNFHKTITLQYRQWILSKIVGNDIIMNGDFSFDKIFINRSKAKYRRLLNIQDVESLILEKGYRIIDLENYSVIEQLCIFYNAKKIVGIHGAGFSNLIVSRAAKVYDLIDEDFNQLCFYKLCRVLDINYHFVRCKGVPNSVDIGSVGHNDLIVNLSELKEIL